MAKTRHFAEEEVLIQEEQAAAKLSSDLRLKVAELTGLKNRVV